MLVFAFDSSMCTVKLMSHELHNLVTLILSLKQRYDVNDLTLTIYKVAHENDISNQDVDWQPYPGISVDTI